MTAFHLVLAAAAAYQNPSPERWLERQAWIMGTTFTIRLPAVPAAGDAAEAVMNAVRATDRLVNTWTASSELARVNRGAAGMRLPLSAALDSLLLKAFSLADSTGHAFEPTLGPLVDAWDLRGAGRLPDSAALARALSETGSSGIGYAPGFLVRRSPAAWIDSDGFGKGAALAAGAAALRARGVTTALLNFGGQVLALGAPGGVAWVIELADPGDRGAAVQSLHLQDVSASTTAQSVRGVHIAGQWYGHVLDPRSGRPVAPWGSVTVVHPDALVADALSTALFVMGPAAGQHWAEANRVAAVFLIADRGGWNISATTVATRMGVLP